MKSLVVFCVFLTATYGRVANSPKEQILNDLLSKADPLDNEIFSEPELVLSKLDEEPSVYKEESEVGFSNPAHHILQTLSKPKYVDASEFRRNQKEEPLPPFIDINRHLTLIRSSHMFAPPEETPVEESEYEEPAEELVRYIPRPAALFREDVADKQQRFNQNINEDEVVIEPDVIVDEPVVVEEVSAPKKSFGKSEPLAHAISPLSHILAGFRSEFGAFGHDVSTDRFISGFRPDDF